MKRHRTPIVLTLLMAFGAAAAVTPAKAAPPRQPATPVVGALDRAAHPLRTVEPAATPAICAPSTG